MILRSHKSPPNVCHKNNLGHQGSYLHPCLKTSGPTCADQVPAQSVSEVVEHSVPVLLHHLGVDVEAGVAQLGDLLGQELHPLGGVAEDDRLVDLELEQKKFKRRI